MAGICSTKVGWVPNSNWRAPPTTPPPPSPPHTHAHIYNGHTLPHMHHHPHTPPLLPPPPTYPASAHATLPPAQAPCCRSATRCTCRRCRAVCRRSRGSTWRMCSRRRRASSTSTAQSGRVRSWKKTRWAGGSACTAASRAATACARCCPSPRLPPPLLRTPDGSRQKGCRCGTWRRCGARAAPRCLCGPPTAPPSLAATSTCPVWWRRRRAVQAGPAAAAARCTAKQRSRRWQRTHCWPSWRSRRSRRRMSAQQPLRLLMARRSRCSACQPRPLLPLSARPCWKGCLPGKSRSPSSSCHRQRRREPVGSRQASSSSSSRSRAAWWCAWRSLCCRA